MTLMMNVQRSSQKWSFWLLLIIVTVYLSLTLKWLIQNQQQQLKLQTTLVALPLLIPIQNLSQQLQAERGLFSGFATQKLPARPAVELRQLQTDAAWRDLELVFNVHLTSSKHLEEYFVTLPKPQHLYLLRQKVLEHQLNSTQVKRSYTELLQPFLNLAEYLQLKNELAGLTRSLSSMTALTYALELAGQERATLHMAFAERQMLPSRYQSYVILVNEQMDFLERFSELTSPALQQQWRLVQSEFENSAFFNLREQALAQHFEEDAALWFALASSRIDRIYQLRSELCYQLQQQALEMDIELRHSFQQFVTQSQLLSLLFLLLVWRLYRLYHVKTQQIKHISPSPQF
jgi:hypothetical protein